MSEHGSKFQRPRVAVLMATYNGAAWIGAQIESILVSEEVEVHIFLSDDGSRDDTVAVARSAAGEAVTVLPPDPKGSAGCNFYRLVQDTPWDAYDYVALSDQDDLWHRDKLARAIGQINAHDLAGYSSDVTAFWPDGREVVLRKSQPQRLWDHCFESAGPGCTFVWPRAEADFLRQRLAEIGWPDLSRIEAHDWLFYALFRSAGKPWLIDDRPGLDYRQHGHNVVGASQGLGAFRARIKMVFSGWYRTQILATAEAIGADNTVLQFLRNPRWWRVGRALRNVRQCRRRSRDVLRLAAYFIVLSMRPGGLE